MNDQGGVNEGGHRPEKVEIKKSKGVNNLIVRFYSKFSIAKKKIYSMLLSKKIKPIVREFIIDDDSQKVSDLWSLLVEKLRESKAVNDLLRMEMLTFSDSLWDM